VHEQAHRDAARKLWIPIALGLPLLAGCGDDGAPPEASTSAADGGSTGSGPAPTSTGGSSGGVDSSGSDSPATSTTTDGAMGSTSGETGVDACGNGLCAPEEDATTCCEDCGVCAEDATVRMETGVEAGGPGTGLTPGGMADTHAQFAGGSFTALTFPFTVVEQPVRGSSYFWAQQFFFENTTQGGYLGLQSNGIISGAAIGKMAIFSIWDATEATPGPGASCEPFGGEGIGYSCRLQFPWRENVTYALTLSEAQPAWWSVHLHDPSTGDDLLLGTIHAPDAWGRVRPPTAGFAEYYGQVDACETMPWTVALLHQPTADGAPPTAVDAGTYGTCVGQASSVCTGARCQ
jgi:hypothetical protein